MTQHVFRIKVTLKGSRPPIWRRLEVPADITLYQLHRVLQAAMGWTDSHLHEFRQGKLRYGASDRELGIHRISERRTSLFEVLRQPRDRLRYEYDFGDSWSHDLVLEEIRPAHSSDRRAHLIKAKRACPPEDVGGLWGYAEFLEAMADPDHPDHEQMVEWWDGPFDPDAVDLTALNRRLARIKL